MENRKLAYALRGYSNSFQARFGSRHREDAKWTMADDFQKYWDVDATDFEAMFRKATANFMLLPIMNVDKHIPLYGTICLLKNHSDDIREYFRKLFTAQPSLEDVQDAALQFCSDMNGLLRACNRSECELYEIQDATLLLSMKYPDKNYIYKPLCITTWCNMIHRPVIATGQYLKLREFYMVCDEARDILLADEGIMEQYQAFMEKRNYNWSDDLHLLVYDLMYYVAYYLR